MNLNGVVLLSSFSFCKDLSWMDHKKLKKLFILKRLLLLG